MGADDNPIVGTGPEEDILSQLIDVLELEAGVTADEVQLTLEAPSTSLNELNDNLDNGQTEDEAARGTTIGRFLKDRWVLVPDAFETPKFNSAAVDAVWEEGRITGVTITYKQEPPNPPFDLHGFNEALRLRVELLETEAPELLFDIEAGGMLDAFNENPDLIEMWQKTRGADLDQPLERNPEFLKNLYSLPCN